MPMGPGVYDDAASMLLDATFAEGVVVIVVNGDRGTGMSVQAPLALTMVLPALLRDVADEIEKSYRMEEM